MLYSIKTHEKEFEYMKSPMLIGIAGGTGSGKSTFAKRLLSLFPNEITVISYDNYYKPQDHLSFEERKYIIEKMAEISDKMAEKDSQNKKFLGAVLAGCGTAVVAVVGIFASVLGGNTKIDIKDLL